MKSKEVIKMMGGIDTLKDKISPALFERMKFHGYRVSPPNFRDIERDNYLQLTCNFQLYGKYAKNYANINLKDYPDFAIQLKREINLEKIL